MNATTLNSKPSFQQVLVNAASQLLDLADTCQHQNDDTKADTVGHIGEKLAGIAQFIGHDYDDEIRIAPQQVHQFGQPHERIAGLIQSLEVAATSVASHDSEIAGELQEMLDELAAL